MVWIVFPRPISSARMPFRALLCNETSHSRPLNWKPTNKSPVSSDVTFRTIFSWIFLTLYISKVIKIQNYFAHINTYMYSIKLRLYHMITNRNFCPWVTEKNSVLFSYKLKCWAPRISWVGTFGLFMIFFDHNHASWYFLPYQSVLITAMFWGKISFMNY